MHQLMNVSNNKMMSSKKIAELTDKSLSHVHRDIREMVAQLDDPVLGHEQYQELKDNRGYISEIMLDEELTMLLITGYSAKARMRVIKELKQLKEQVQQPKALTLEQLLQQNVMMIQDLSQKVVTLEATVQQQAPAVAAIERLGSSKGSLCLTDAAKALDMNPRAFMAWLEMNGWIFKRVAGDNWTAYQTKMDAGYLEMISVPTGELGQEKMRKQCKVTASGMVKLAKLFDAINNPSKKAA
jgi:phage antirepressor YoqD-like protein